MELGLKNVASENKTKRLRAYIQNNFRQLLSWDTNTISISQIFNEHRIIILRVWIFLFLLFCDWNSAKHCLYMTLAQWVLSILSLEPFRLANRPRPLCGTVPKYTFKVFSITIYHFNFILSYINRGHNRILFNNQMSLVSLNFVPKKTQNPIQK